MAVEIIHYVGDSFWNLLYRSSWWLSMCD